DPEAVELHFALGSLVRRRGETERAIRMHRSLLERPDLGDEQRVQALYELGQDYLKAGLLDRAEETFIKLREGPHRPEAGRHLLDIYQQEKEWQKAIDVAQLLERDSGQSWQKEIANFHCEVAAIAISKGRIDEARARLEDALAANRKCVRASLMLGDVAVSAGDHAVAIEHWTRVEVQNPTYLSLVAHRLLKSYQALGRDREGVERLRTYLANYPSLDLLDVVFQST